jgi:hypothetical protein
MKHEKYFSIYENILSKYKNKKIRLVEIGIENGGSLYMWRKFLPDAEIIGIDLNPNCKKFEKDGFKIEIGDQSLPKFWDEFFKKYKNVDVIIDDGGHTNSQQITTAISCIPYIKDEGVLITEDIMCSYYKDFDNPNIYSFINFSKKLIDDVNYKFPKLGNFKFSLNDYIYSIEFFESVVVFKINRKLCYFNNTITNNGKNENHKDLRYNFELKKLFKRKIFIKYKIFRKINNLYQTYMMRSHNRKNSKKMKKYFE